MAKYHYGNFKVVRVKDGDTIVALMDLGFTVKVEIDFRLVGINAPEKRGATRTAGQAATEYLTRLLTEDVEHLEMRSLKSPKVDLYGRWLARIFVFRPDGQVIDVSRHMIEAGHAVPFMGELEDIDLDPE